MEGGFPPYKLRVSNSENSLWTDLLNPDSLNWYAIESEINFNDTLHVLDKLKQEIILYYQDCPGPLEVLCKREDGQLKINVEGGHPPYELWVNHPNNQLSTFSLLNPDSLNWYSIESEIKFNDTL